MSKTKWTEEQLKAIETRKCNLLIAAAAGSGKTAVLVERIIRIITNEENPVDIDRLLVVTFTSAAAAEMRERIAVAITEALEKNPNSKNLQKQLTLLSRANITTMHSFCLDVIKNNFHVIDLDPSFRILDDTEGILLKGEILEELFEEKYEAEDKDFLNLVEAYSDSRSDEKLKNIILELYNFSMSGPWPEKWLQEKSDEFNINSLEELNSSKWIKVYMENIDIELQGMISMLEKARELSAESGGLEPYVDTFNDDISMILAVHSSLGNIEELYNSINSVKFGRIKTVKKSEVEDLSMQEQVKAIRDDVKKKIKKLQEDVFSMSPWDMLVSIQKSYPYMKALTNIVIEFNNRFSESKRDKGALDFNDLEHLCLQILRSENDNVSNRFKEYFDEVLVDEYQDSNNVQESIIDLVSRKNDNDPNVFMVGDVKQSIYRFRQAKPELFLEKYNSYSKDEGRNRKIQLYKNFRSRNEVIQGVNYIFKELMSKTVGELEYTDEEALNLGASFKELNGEGKAGGEIELHIFDKSESLEIEEIPELTEEDEEIGAINLEARIVSKRIKELISGEGEKQMVLDKITGEYRPVTYKDIVILLRATKNWAEIFLDELGTKGIPVYADTGSGYFESIEIRTILSLLKVIDNPMQDVPLIALLRSPIIKFSDEELAQIRLIDKNKYFYENIMSITLEETQVSQELYNKCIDFIERLEKYRNKSIYTPIDEFIWYLYTDTGYYGYVAAMPNGVLRQANLRILFQRAKQYEQTSFKGLFNFINFINKLRKSSGDMGSAKILGENENVVRIMSIHKSKGLEFPVVFLCGTGKQFNLMDLNKNILYHEDLGLGPEYVDLEKRISYPTLAKESIKQRIRQETLSEEMRILYVALTRPKEKVIITGCVNDIEKWASKVTSAATLDDEIIIPSEVLKGKSYLDWIGMALCKHKDGEEIRNIVNAMNIHIRSDLSTWKIKLWTKKELIVDKINEDVDETEEKELWITKNKRTVDKEIDRRLNYIYKYSQATQLKSNFSVSDIKKKNQDEEEYTKTEELFSDKEIIKPKFLQEKTGLTAAEKGTAMHYVMQKIDLDRISSINQIKEQLNELANNELLSEEELKVINVYKIFNFFKSNLGKRMLFAYKNGHKIYREFSFYTEISPIETDNTLPRDIENEKVRLQGIIDCFFYEGEKLILLDYKTDYVTEDNLDEIKEKYKIQLRYYKEALEKITGDKVSQCYLYLFGLEREEEI